MIYVSFVEIFVKSNGAFMDHGMEESDAYYAATGCLFGGMVLLRLIAFLVHRIDPSHKHCSENSGPEIRSNVMGAGDLPAPQAINTPDAIAPEGVAPAMAGEVVASKDKKLERMGLNTA